MLQTTAANLRIASPPEEDPPALDLPASYTSPASSGGEEIDLPADVSDATTTVNQDPLMLTQLSLWLGALLTGTTTALNTNGAETGQSQSPPLIDAMITPSQAPQPTLVGSFPTLRGAEAGPDIPQPADSLAPATNAPQRPTATPSPADTPDALPVADTRLQPEAAVASLTMHASSSPPSTPIMTSDPASTAAGPLPHSEVAEQLTPPSDGPRRATGQASSPPPPDSDESPATIVTEPSERFSGTTQDFPDDGHQDASAGATPDIVRSVRSRRPEPIVVPAGTGEVSPKEFTTQASAPEPAVSTLTHQASPDMEPVPIVTQLFDHMHVAIREGRHELRLALTPENLGTVQVEILTDNQEIHAHLLVETPLIKEMLEENLYKLKDALQAHGLHIHELNVSVGQHCAQHESTAGSLPFDERSWKAPREMTVDDANQSTSRTSHQVRITTDSLQIDLFA